VEFPLVNPKDLIGKTFDVADTQPDGVFFAWGEGIVEDVWGYPDGKFGISIKLKGAHNWLRSDMESINPVEGGFNLPHASNVLELRNLP
jgi:hypothetical protein